LLTFFRIIATFGIFCWQLGYQVWICFTDNIGDLLVTEVAGRDEETLRPCLRELHSLDMGKCQISDVCPDESPCGSDFLFRFAGHDITDPLVGGVQRVQTVEVVDYWTKDKGRVHGNNVKIGLFLLDEIP